MMMYTTCIPYSWKFLKEKMFDTISHPELNFEDLPELEIAVGHWPFSKQFQDLADQN